MFRKIFIIIVLFSLVGSVAIAQTTGRIIGKVVDGQTGEVLIGANVIVVGTSLGAATDVSGEFLISQIPPGTYNLRATYIGYQDVLLKGVRVIAGLTQTENFHLLPSAVATKEIVVISQRPLIQKSATNAVRIVGSEDIESLPVRDLNRIVALQPGVVMQNGVTFIRGSRPDATGYILEGADVRNVISRNGGGLVDITPDALQEILVQAGGFTAEFGGANAGIIQSDFKTGTDQYHFSLRGETDNFGNYPGQKFLGTYSYGYSDYVFTASGPLISNKLKLFISGENYFTRDYTSADASTYPTGPMFFYGNPQRYSDGALFDTTKVYDTGVLGGNTNDYQILKWKPGNIPGRLQNRYTFNGTALLDEKPLTLRFAAAYTWYQNRNNTSDISNMFNLERLGMTDNTNLMLALKGTYFISSNSYLEANVNLFDTRSRGYDPNFGNNFLSYSDSIAAAQHGWAYQNYYSGPVNYDFYGFPFTRPGADLVGYAKDHNSYLGGSLAYNAVISNNSLKAGASYTRWTVRSWSNNAPATMLSTLRANPDMASNSDSLNFLMENVLYKSFNNYGFDLFGNETDAGEFAARHPIFGSGYVEDRLEISDLIINAGLRYDYINMDSWAWVNPQLPSVNYTTHFLPDSAIKKSSAFSYLSPRLGFSFPVTDQTVFHMQYGKFVQNPSLDLAYQGVYQVSQQLTGANLYLSPIAYNPEPVRTTQYEIGFTQQFTDFAALDLTAYYKDVKGDLQYAVVQTLPGASRAKYNTFANQDFSTTKGIELNLRIRRVERIRAELNYTYADASGTNSFVSSGLGSVEVNGNVPTVLIPLTYNQTHRGSLMIDYRFGKDDGGPIFEQLGLNLLFTFNSGHPFTLAMPVGLGQSSAWTGGLIPATDNRGRRPIGPINSSNTPWNYNLDLKIDKTFTVYNTDVNVYVYVQNLLNTKNVINVYDQTGNAYDDGFLNSTDAQGLISKPEYTQRFADLYNALNLGNREHALSVMNEDMFGTPRQLRAGVLVNF